MTFHLYGNILTFYGVAANNRGENQGNITTLQKTKNLGRRKVQFTQEHNSHGAVTIALNEPKI